MDSCPEAGRAASLLSSANMLLPPDACCRIALLEAVQLARWMMRGVSCQSLATGSAARSSTRPRERRRV